MLDTSYRSVSSTASEDSSGDSIVVTELPDAEGEGFFGTAMNAYRHDGFHAGYS
ncbi:MAG: hypothetical protein JWO48_3289, partial [Bryobacterales bacterium]|nr:hypothetical protein [Bryobacterales bacterium]